MRSFLESLNPLKSFEDPLPVIPENDSLISLTSSSSLTLENNNKKETPDTRLNNYMFAKSLEIEARGSRAPKKFERRWPDLTLKSPGIKPMSVTATLGRGSKTPFNVTSNSNSFTGGADQNQMSPTSTAACTTPVHSISDPTTPLSPTHLHAGASSENSVFANVVIGPVPFPRVPPTPTGTAFPFPLPSSSPINLMTAPAAAPPPLPPRTSRGPSRPPPATPSAVGESADSPPPLPPRGVPVPGPRPGPSGPPPPPPPHHHSIHLPFTRNNSFTSSSVPPTRAKAVLHQRQESRP